MAFFAILFGLLIVGVVITGFILYWIVMIALIMLGAIFFFWAYLFAYMFDGNLVFIPCAIIATGLTFWAFNAYSERKDGEKTQGGS
jgi:hypothetical protein